MSEDVLYRLAQTIRTRRKSGGQQSYTRKLLDRGPEYCVQKFGEEAVETVIAALTEDDKSLKGEAADLLYHLLVVLESRNVEFLDVLNVLEERMGTSGLAEKAARNNDGTKIEG